MARKLSQMASELHSWSQYYRAKHAAFPDRDPTEALLGRAYFLDGVAHQLDEVADTLVDIPRTS